jgi:acyl carrier protein
MEEDIRSFIVQHLAKDSGALKNIHDPIFTSGVVDSFGVVQLVSYIYEQYQVDIDPATVDIKDMDTAAGIAQLIRQRRGEGGSFGVK